MLFSRVCLGERREQWESIRLFFLMTKEWPGSPPGGDWLDGKMTDVEV